MNKPPSDREEFEMETVAHEGDRYGIPYPKMVRHTYRDAYGTLTSALTPESERAWANYLRDVNIACRAHHARR